LHRRIRDLLEFTQEKSDWKSITKDSVPVAEVYTKPPLWGFLMS